MFDLRRLKKVDLLKAVVLKPEVTYQFEDELTKKKLIAKFIGYYDDSENEYLIAEFKKMALLSAEPEIATVYFLATGNYGGGEKGCYIMDFIQGETLGKILSKQNEISYTYAIDILIQLASGLEKAHHYEIYHCDLHNENIIIDQFGYVKLIDFLWMGSKMSKEYNVNLDLAEFKRIANELYEKLSPEDKKTYKIILDLCNKITSFKGIKNHLTILNNVALDFSLLDENAIITLGVILRDIIPSATLNHLLIEKDVFIPVKYIPEITDQEKEFIEKERTGKLRLTYMDSRGATVQENLMKQFRIKLHQLKQAGYIDWELGVQNTGEKFIGPYELEFRIYFTSKLFKLKRLNMELDFMKYDNQNALITLLLK